MPSGLVSGVVKAVIRRSQRAARLFHLRAAPLSGSRAQDSHSFSSPRNGRDDSKTFKDLLIGEYSFCFCIPTRYGVMVEAILTITIASIIATMVWFEVDTERDISIPLTGRKILILLGMWWTCLLTASLFGLAGSIIRKRIFIMIYGAYLYLHFLVTITVAVGLMGVVFWASEQQIILACQGVIRDHPTSQQCARLLNKTKGRLVFLGLLTLLLELYGACIVMRYARELRSEPQRLLEGEPSELEPITSRRSRSLEDLEKDSATSGYSDSDSVPDDEDYSRRLRPLYTIGESSSRDSSADRSSRLEMETNDSTGSSSDTAVDDDGLVPKGKLS